LAESVTGIRVTQGFSREALNAQMFGNLVHSHAGYNMAAARANGAFAPAIEFFNQIVVAFIFALGGYWALKTGTIDVEELIAFYFASSNMRNPKAVLGNQYVQAPSAMAGAERVFKLLDTPPDFAGDANAKSLAPIKGKVEF